jgi:hypothetical protein
MDMLGSIARRVTRMEEKEGGKDSFIVLRCVYVLVLGMVMRWDVRIWNGFGILHLVYRE